MLPTIGYATISYEYISYCLNQEHNPFLDASNIANNFCFVKLWKLRLLIALFVSNDFVWVVGVGGYVQLCCPASPKLLLGLDLGLGCNNFSGSLIVFQSGDNFVYFWPTISKAFLSSGKRASYVGLLVCLLFRPSVRPLAHWSVVWSICQKHSQARSHLY